MNAHISIPLGITIGLLASFVQSLGLTIQRKSHVINQGLPEHKRLVEHRRPLWLLGFAIFISSNLLGSLVQIAALPVVILAPLGAVSLLWNAFFAKLLLGDVFSPWMVLGTLLIAGGAVLIAVFGIVPEQTRSLEDLLELFRRPAFIAYFSVLGVVVFICLAITHVTEFSLARKATRSITPQSSPESTPSSLTLRSLTYQPDQGEVADINNATEHTPLLHKSHSSDVNSNQQTAPPPKNTRLLLAISYASFSGIISGMCLLFAKSGVELLLLTLRGQNQFWRWEAWALVLGLGAFALLQLWYLHKALIFADPTLVCPSAFCFYNVSSIVNGLIYFDQFALIPAKHLMLVSVGMIILLGGVWVVSIQSGSGVVDVVSWEEANKTARVAGSTIQSSEDGSPTALTSALPEEEASYPGTPDTIPMNATLDDRASTVDSASRKRTTHRRRPTIDLGLSLHARPSPHNQAQPPTLIGTGLQIGLSPVSPGFAILPKERRRRVSGMVESPRQDLEGEGGLRPERLHARRAVSENDVGDTETSWRPTTTAPAEGVVEDGTQLRSKDGVWRRMRRAFIRE